MRVLEFEPFCDLIPLCDWLAAHKHPVLEEKELPALGWIAYDGETPVATAFLRMVEGGMAQLDGLCTNPTLPGAQRHEAIDLVVAKCLEEAKARGITKVYALSVDEGILVRSQKHGFVRAPHVLIVHNPKGVA